MADDRCVGDPRGFDRVPRAPRQVQEPVDPRPWRYRAPAACCSSDPPPPCRRPPRQNPPEQRDLRGAHRGRPQPRKRPLPSLHIVTNPPPRRRSGTAPAPPPPRCSRAPAAATEPGHPLRLLPRASSPAPPRHPVRLRTAARGARSARAPPWAPQRSRSA